MMITVLDYEFGGSESVQNGGGKVYRVSGGGASVAVTKRSGGIFHFPFVICHLFWD